MSDIEQKPETKVEPAKAGYYKDKRSKVIDFLIGFLACPLGVWTIGAISERFEVHGGLAAMLLTAVLAVVSLRGGRKYITLGIASAILVPIIVIGSCILIAQPKFY